MCSVWQCVGSIFACSVPPLVACTADTAGNKRAHLPAVSAVCCRVFLLYVAVCSVLQCVAVYSLASCSLLSPCCSAWCSVCCSVCCSACCSARCLAPAIALSFVWYAGKRGACNGAENWAVTGTVSYAAGTASWTSSANSIAFAFSNRQQRSPSVSLTSTLCSCKKPTISSRRLLPPHDRLLQPVRSRPTASNILRGVQDTECEFFFRILEF